MKGEEKEIKLEKKIKSIPLHGLADLHWAARTKHTKQTGQGQIESY